MPINEIPPLGGEWASRTAAEQEQLDAEERQRFAQHHPVLKTLHHQRLKMQAQAEHEFKKKKKTQGFI